MELNILWLYHDMKDVFGDAGNIQVLKKRCETREIACRVTTCGIGDEVTMTDYDLIYFGTNLHGKDTYVMQDLLKRKQQLEEAIQKGVFFFLVCGGYQAFGREYRYEDEVIAGLDILSYYSDYRTPANCIGNLFVSSSWVKQPLIGFENHQYQIMNNEHPLGKVTLGKGNDGTNLQEGYLHECILGTNMHGPLLPKNPQLADKILQTALLRRYPDINITFLPDTLEEKARMAIQNRFKEDV